MSENQRFEDLLNTIKKITELQRAGALPKLGNTPDPDHLDDLRQTNPQAYLAALQRSANDIRQILSSLDHRGGLTTLSPRPRDQVSTASSTTAVAGPPPNLPQPPLTTPRQRPSGQPRLQLGSPTVLSPSDYDEDDLYENTGPGSRLATLGREFLQAGNESGKIFN